MSDPTIDAARDVLAESLDKIRSGIAGLTVDQLNAKPAGGETNSVAVIATHALASTPSYLGMAGGAPPARVSRGSSQKRSPGEGRQPRAPLARPTRSRAPARTWVSRSARRRC